MRKEYDFSKGKRGAILPTPPGKTRITIRLDEVVLDWFRQQVDAAGGGNYQTLINQALLEHIVRRKEPLEDTLRRVLREEWSGYSTGTGSKTRRERSRNPAPLGSKQRGAHRR